MEREFYRRGQMVRVEEVPGVRALRAEQAQRAAEMDAVPESRVALDEVLADVEMGAGLDELTTRELSAFEEAGWAFVRIPTEDHRDVLAEAVDPTADAAKVFVDEDGRLLVGTNLMNVKLDERLGPDEARKWLEGKGFQIARALTFAPNLFQVLVPPDRDVLDASVELQETENVVYAEPEFIEDIPPRLRPADPDYRDQWQWRNDGSNGGRRGADISAEPAWDLATGDGVRIAVIDNACDVAHPDLQPISRLAGYFVGSVGSVASFRRSLQGFPSNRHGTFCAGMAAARANNGHGGCGAAFDAELMPIATLPDTTSTQSTLARAVAYSADPSREDADVDAGDGADVISCSLGPNGSPWRLTSVLEDALRFATSRGRGGLGTPVFWAVDNTNVRVSQDEVCSHETTIAVGRSTSSDLADGSATGPELEFLAPGVEVYSTTHGGGYGFGTGTSYAAPVAAGVAALVLTRNRSLTAEGVRQVLRDTCEKIGNDPYPNGRNDTYGYGRIDAERALAKTHE